MLLSSQASGLRFQSTPFGPPLGMIERPFFSSRFLGSCPATGFRWPGVGLAVTAEAFVLKPPSRFEVGHYVLYSGVVLEAVHREILAVARVLEAAVGHLGHEGDVSVDPHAPEVQPPADPHRPAVVLGEHAGGEAVLDAVCPPYRLILIGEGLHGDDGTEDLRLRSLIFLPEAGDHGGGVEKPPVAEPLAADGYLSVVGKPLDHARDVL